MLEREQVKTYLSRSPRAYWAASVLYENALYPAHIVRQGLTSTALRLPSRTAADTVRQGVLTWELSLPDTKEPTDLIRWLRSNGVEVSEGGHTFYLAPQPALRQLLPEVVSFYPDGSGFKILKDFREPPHARYIYRHRRWLPILRRLIGSPQNQLAAANYMHALGIAPRIWDLTCWKSHRQCRTVFVVEHVVGQPPGHNECLAFLQRLHDLNARSHLRVLIPEWERHEDFTPPDCHGNLIHAPALGRPLYVDFQNFGLTSPAIWSREVESRADCARDGMDGRALFEAVQQHTSGCSRRVLVDVGCNDSRVLSRALADGAAWVVGICETRAVPLIEEALLATGATRFTLVPLDRSRSWTRDFPTHLRWALHDAIVFWRTGEDVVGSLTPFDVPCATLIHLGTDAAAASRFRRRAATAAHVRPVPSDASRPTLTVLQRFNA